MLQLCWNLIFFDEIFLNQLTIVGYERFQQLQIVFLTKFESFDCFLYTLQKNPTFENISNFLQT